jgi:DNA-binding NarL/FixJ family response regulator
MENFCINVIEMNEYSPHYNFNNTEKLKLLLIDSSELILSRIKDMLRDYSFVGNIVTSTKITNIIKLIEEISPDALIIDISTYNHNSIQVVQSIKKIYPSVKVIMQTNLSEQYYNYYKWLFEQLGADYFIDKSNEFDLLQDILKEIHENKKRH